MLIPHFPDGRYRVQKHSRCSSETIITTIDECSRAKAALDAGAPAVNKEDYEGAPYGCYRHEGRWFFNTQATDTLDSVSEPVCKDIAGASNYLTSEEGNRPMSKTMLRH